MSRVNHLCAIIFWFSIAICFFYSGLVQGRPSSFTVPQNYDPTSTLSKAQYKEGELIVRFAPKAEGIQRTIVERNAILLGLGGGEVTRTYKMVPGLSLVKLPAGMKVKEVLTDFNKSPEILYAQPNYIYKLLSTFPNDPNFPQLWGMHNTGQPHLLNRFEGGGVSSGTPGADIDAPQAWDITTGSSDIIVAVIDSGIDYNHPDLADNMWVNPGEIPGNGIDDDNNGYIDDFYGYDFCDDDADPMDDFYHGTHCAGTVGAIGNNNEGVTGVCWNVKIMALKMGFIYVFKITPSGQLYPETLPEM